MSGVCPTLIMIDFGNLPEIFKVLKAFSPVWVIDSTIEEPCFLVIGKVEEVMLWPANRVLLFLLFRLII